MATLHAVRDLVFLTPISNGVTRVDDIGLEGGKITVEDKQ